jgi:hypothetical protein
MNLEKDVTRRFSNIEKRMDEMDSEIKVFIGLKEDVMRTDDWLELLRQNFDESSFRVSPNLISGSSNHVSVFIRKSYRDMCSTLVKIQSAYPSRNRNYLITGTPGIGKSYFAFYLLYHLLAKPGDLILYQNCHIKMNYYVVLECKSPNNDYSIHHYRGSEINNYLSKKAPSCVSWYIFDGWHTPGAVPQPCDVPTIVLSSPDCSQYKEFCQYNPVKLYMPPWEWEEIGQLITMLHPEGNREIVEKAKETYDFWGGVVREVLSPHVDARKAVLDGAIARSDVGTVVQFVQACGDVPKCVSHKVLHQKPIVDEQGRMNFTQIRMDFASDYVKKRIMQKYSQGLESADNLLKFARCLYLVKQPRQLCGGLFELAVHKGIKSNYKYEARYLGKWRGNNNSHHGYIIPEFSGHRKVNNLARNIKESQWSLPQEYKRCYWEPKLDCFPAIDSFIPSSNFFFQITIAKNHKVATKELRMLINKLAQGSQPEDIHLIFVTLPEVFDEFPVQGPSDYDSNKSGQAAKETFKRVKQYVMKFPTNSGFAGENEDCCLTRLNLQ